MRVEFVPIPAVKQFTLFSPVAELKKNVIANESVRFSIRFHTKTYLTVSVEGGNASFKINEPSEYSVKNNIKLISKTDWNLLSGSQSINHYFKLNKKQNLKVFENHIVSLTEKLFTDLHLNDIIDKDNFLIEIELPNELMVKRAMGELA